MQRKLLKVTILFLEHAVLSNEAKWYPVEILVTQVTKITPNYPWNSGKMDYQSYSYVNRKVWCHQIWIPNNLGFMVLILMFMVCISYELNCAGVKFAMRWNLLWIMKYYFFFSKIAFCLTLEYWNEEISHESEKAFPYQNYTIIIWDSKSDT